MKRARVRAAGPFLLAAPLALLTGACAFRPWTPSVSVAYWSQEAPLSGPKMLPTASEIYARWQLSSSIVWWRYSKTTLISSLDSTQSDEEIPVVQDLEVVQRAQDVGRHLAKIGVPSDVMFLVDMRGAASVAFGAELSKSTVSPIAPVLTFNNWPAEDELVPAEETLAALIAFSPQLPSADAVKPRPVFLLDAWRLAYRFDEPDYGVHDNRYVVSAHDLPDVAMLQSQGISRVIYLVEDLDESEVEEDDLHPILGGYQLAGLELSMMDLRSLANIATLERPAVDLREHRLVIEDRDILLDDPQFYERAHGGFGGLHAAPSIGSPRVVWGVHGGFSTGGVYTGGGYGSGYGSSGGGGFGGGGG